jgi:quinol monooxygenase YgiN
MLVRLVRMTFRPDALDAFLDHFDRVAPRIRAFDGCKHLELWHDPRFPNVCTTYSQWRDDDALEAYRASDLFRGTWSEVKTLFAAPPVAQSLAPVRASEAIARRALDAPPAPSSPNTTA